MDIATKCQTHSAIKSHSKKEYIVRLLFDEKGYEIGRKPWVLKTVGEVVRCKDCKYGAISYPLYCRNAKGLAAIENENDFCSYGERREE